MCVCVYIYGYTDDKYTKVCNKSLHNRIQLIKIFKVNICIYIIHIFCISYILLTYHLLDIN